MRMERVNDRGVRETAPRLFPAEELPNLETVADLFGGGEYWFTALSLDFEITATHPARKSERLPLAGRSKPFRRVPYDEPSGVEASSSPATSSSPDQALEVQCLLLRAKLAETRAAAAEARADRLIQMLIAMAKTPAPVAAPPRAPATSLAHLQELASVLRTLQGESGGGLGALKETAETIARVRGVGAPMSSVDDIPEQLSKLFAQIKPATLSAPHAQVEERAPETVGAPIWIEGLGWAFRVQNQPQPPSAPVAAPAVASTMPAASVPVVAPSPAPSGSAAPAASLPGPWTSLDDAAAAFLHDPAFRARLMANLHAAAVTSRPAEAATEAPVPPTPSASAPEAASPAAPVGSDAPAPTSATSSAGHAAIQAPAPATPPAQIRETESGPGSETRPARRGFLSEVARDPEVRGVPPEGLRREAVERDKHAA